MTVTPTTLTNRRGQGAGAGPTILLANCRWAGLASYCDAEDGRRGPAERVRARGRGRGRGGACRRTGGRPGRPGCRGRGPALPQGTPRALLPDDGVAARGGRFGAGDLPARV